MAWQLSDLLGWVGFGLADLDLGVCRSQCEGTEECVTEKARARCDGRLCSSRSSLSRLTTTHQSHHVLACLHFGNSLPLQASDACRLLISAHSAHPSA